MKKKYKDWTLIEWDGNSALKLKCYRKSFRNGHVSVGVGEFQLVCYSYGANSDFSMSGTRWDYDNPPISEQDTMAFVDKCKGYPRVDAFRMGLITSKEETKRRVIFSTVNWKFFGKPLDKS